MTSDEHSRRFRLLFFLKGLFQRGAMLFVLVLLGVISGTVTLRIIGYDDGDDSV